ncbi:hypothetical protein L484_009874 [Morus notabilis]|uniref:Disease resistance protein n=1 Tax=Morus notabilis TaxID=981085 RepID=W9R794_9ROSA|nr:hypothetical protein L484_009874 [Morus notabilis]
MSCPYENEATYMRDCVRKWSPKDLSLALEIEAENNTTKFQENAQEVDLGIDVQKQLCGLTFNEAKAGVLGTAYIFGRTDSSISERNGENILGKARQEKLLVTVIIFKDGGRVQEGIQMTRWTIMARNDSMPGTSTSSFSEMHYSGSCVPLSKLKHLIISDVGDMEFPLTSVSIRGCPSLESLPEGLSNLISLESLRIEGCPSLASLPTSIGNLPFLQFVNGKYCTD